jgi:HKD family nuclease
MDLLLHPPTVAGTLSGYYERAFKDSTELFVITAYLTDWNSALNLNPECKRFRVIIGSDFGITRRAACEKIMRWLPPNRKDQFLVADRIDGFHPKAVFWKDRNGECFALVGSSNLTRAAFETNYEANAFCQLSEADYIRAKKWVMDIERQSVVVSEDWLKGYIEAAPGGTHRARRRGKGSLGSESVIEFNLPTPRRMEELIIHRRKALVAYGQQRIKLENLFRRCANGRITSSTFYEELPRYWSEKVGDRMQGFGFEIKGKHSNFQLLSQSFINILDAPDEDRDYMVSKEIDQLRKMNVPTRGAFLSEMLCLRFPNYYPVLAKPVWKYLQAMEYRAPRNSSEGSYYIFLSKALRTSLLHNPEHPAKNLAELDTVIWLAYGKENRSGPQD